MVIKSTTAPRGIISISKPGARHFFIVSPRIIPYHMYRSAGFRINLTRRQADCIGMVLDAQRATYNWAISRLKEDTTLTRFDLAKEFTVLRRATPWLRGVPARYQHAAIHRARTAADISNKHGNGNLKYRTRKNPLEMVECEEVPTFVDNRSV